MAKRDTRLSGLNPLSYIGVESRNPMQLIRLDRDPTTHDRENVSVGALCINESTQRVFMLVGLSSSSATWKVFYETATVTDTIVTDSGTVVPASQSVSILGDGFIETSGSGSIVMVSMLQGNDGEVFIGKTGGVPAWGNITSTGGTVVITNGPNSINLESSGVAPLTTLSADSGSASPIGGDIVLTGGANITTSASGATVSVALNDSITTGGTLTLSAFGVGVVQTDSSGIVTSDTGTNGQVLIGGGSAPAWANIASADGSVVITNGANSIDLAANANSPNLTGFSAYVGSAITNVTGDGTEYDVVFDTEIFDTGGNYNNTTGVYTVPVDGKYFFGGKVDLRVDSGSGGTCYNSYIIASAGSPARTPGIAIPTRRRASNYYGYNEDISSSCQAILDLSAGDTVKFTIVSFGGSKVDDIPAPAAGERSSYFFGYLIRSD